MKITDRIIPVPQRVTRQGEETVNLQTGYRILAENISGFLAQKAVQRLTGELENRLGPQTADGIAVILSLDNAPEDMPNSDQGYRLSVQAEKVTLTGYGEAGLFYGVTTLLQCLENGWYLEMAGNTPGGYTTVLKNNNLINGILVMSSDNFICNISGPPV